MNTFNLHSNLLKIILNYTNKFFTLISIFLVTPIYLKTLGIENYGVISFYSLILGVLTFADAGMSSLITKELASNELNNNYKYNIFIRIERIYVILVIILILIISLNSYFIADKWLNTRQIPISDLNKYVILIGILANTQLISSLYYGALIGIDKPNYANIYQIIANFSKSFIVIFILIKISNTLYTFFIWQIFCNLIYIFLSRKFIVKNFKSNIQTYNIKFKDGLLPRHVKNYIKSMSVITLISAINSQIDKIVISSVFSLKVFGAYSIVSQLAQIPLMLAIPLSTFIFPIFSKHVNNPESLKKVLSLFCNLLYLLIFPACMLLLFYSDEVIEIWTRKTLPTDLIHELSFILKTLTIGSLFLALQFPCYYLLLSKGEMRYNIIQGIFQLIFSIPALVFITKFYGFKFIGLPWIMINFFGFIYLYHVTNYKLYKSKNYKFIINYLIIPLVINLVITSLLFLLYIEFKLNFYFTSIISTILIILSHIFYVNLINNVRMLSFETFLDFPKEH